LIRVEIPIQGDRSHLLWRQACLEHSLHLCPYLPYGRSLRAQFSKNDADCRIVLVPSNDIRLTNATLQCMNDVVEQHPSLALCVSPVAEFDEQQQKGPA